MIRNHTNQAFLLTPPGAGAIGVIRVVGSEAVAKVDQFFQSKSGVSLTTSKVDRLYYGDLVIDNEIIDDVIINRNSFPDPSSLDICSHSGIRIVERILQALEDGGFRIVTSTDETQPSWPVSSVIEKEINDALIHATTIRAVRFLAGQRNCLVKALNTVAGCWNDKPAEARKKLETIRAGYMTAKRLIEGVTIAIIGPPNSGKSTLFNLLLGRSATVTSPRAGTTRDWVEESIEIDGVPIRLIDTAGCHVRANDLERRAIRAGIERGDAAHLRLLVLDGAQPLSGDLSAQFEDHIYRDDTVTILNKQDLYNMAEMTGNWGRIKPVCVSAKTGSGIELLYESLLQKLGFEGWNEDLPCLFTARQDQVVAEILSPSSAESFDAASALRNHLIGC